MIETDLQSLIDSLDANLQFISELLQADIRLFIKQDHGAYIHSYFHPNQDSLYLGSHEAKIKRGEKLQSYKDPSVDRAFRLGKPIIGQYGLVINNRRIQEFAYPIFHDSVVVAVIAVERDIYLTRNILGQHWDFMADNLIKALKDKISNSTRFPHIAFGEGALFIQGENKTIFFANPLAVNLLGEIAENVKQLVGRSFDEIFSSFQRKYKGNDSKLSIEAIEEITLRQRTIALRYIRLNPDMSVVLIKDNSEIKIKETLLKEIHHRVKNNLQTVVSLLQLQKRRNPELEDAFTEAISRTNSISLVHEYLAHSNDIEHIDFGFLVQKILKSLLASFGADHLSINFDCPQKVLIISEEATNLALVLNEILSNCLEHTAGTLSKIDIKLFHENGKLHMSVEDDGGGFKDNFDYRQSTGLGWGIVQTITEESLKGKLSIGNTNHNGVRGLKVHLTIPHAMDLL